MHFCLRYIAHYPQAIMLRENTQRWVAAPYQATAALHAL